MAKVFFKEHNLKYQDVDVTTNTKERDQMVTKSGQRSVPVIEIDSRVLVGFRTGYTRSPRIISILY
jgi:glutaredoxin